LAQFKPGFGVLGVVSHVKRLEGIALDGIRAMLSKRLLFSSFDSK
jgi:hypothetical protein